SKTRQSLAYGQLAKGQKLTKEIGDDAPMTPATQWKVMDTSAPKADIRDFVTGRHKYTSDLTRRGMLYGKIVRPSAFHATLVSVTTREAEAISGVTVVHDGDFIGVVAPHPEVAARAAQAIKAEWKAPPQPSDKDLFEYLKKRPAEAQGFEGNSRQEQGSMD